MPAPGNAGQVDSMGTVKLRVILDRYLTSPAPANPDAA
jgi:hypothetical protein